MSVAMSVIEGDWGGASTSDLLAVVGSTAECFEHGISETVVEAIQIEPTPAPEDVPITLFSRSETGQVRILLNVRGTLWARLAYQFAHEFCHVLANFRPPLHHPSKWIEESLCELSSLYALRSMARRWQNAAPYRNWTSYAPHLADYAEERCRRAEHQLPAGMAFPDWLTSRLPLLQSDSVRRADNTIVACRLLPVFEHDEDAWRAIRYLNLWDATRSDSVEHFCNGWRSVTPIELRPLVDRIEDCLTQV